MLPYLLQAKKGIKYLVTMAGTPWVRELAEKKSQMHSLPWVQIQIHHLLPTWPRENHLISKTQQLTNEDKVIYLAGHCRDLERQ